MASMENKPNKSLLERVRLGLSVFSIASTAVSAGGVFIFPMLAPALSAHLKLSQPQLTTVVLAGVIGQYPFAAVVGKIIDRWGPGVSSLASSILFGLGFGLFAAELESAGDVTSNTASLASFHRLVLYFGMCGLATVFSLFASLITASKTFPGLMGMASGASMTLFGLSPLLYSLVATHLFSEPDTGLEVIPFLRFMAVWTAVIHLVGAMTLIVPSLEPTPVATPAEVEAEEGTSSGSVTPLVDERQPLLPNKSLSLRDEDIDYGPAPEEDKTALQLLRDPDFWMLFVTVLLTLGACEMVVSNIGSIVLSLPSADGTHPDSHAVTDAITSTQVKVISVSNTLTRLLAGPVSDFTSPVPSVLANGRKGFHRRHYISRISFLSGSILLLAATALSMELFVRSQEAVILLSIGVGIVYGAAFTMLPSITSSIWGMTNFARNFGFITYAPFIGTPVFSYFYAFVSASHAGDGEVCKGVSCWETTFWFVAAASIVAFTVSLVLWKRWHGKL